VGEQAFQRFDRLGLLCAGHRGLRIWYSPPGEFPATDLAMAPRIAAQRSGRSCRPKEARPVRPKTAGRRSVHRPLPTAPEGSLDNYDAGGPHVPKFSDRIRLGRSLSEKPRSIHGLTAKSTAPPRLGTETPDQLGQIRLMHRCGGLSLQHPAALALQVLGPGAQLDQNLQRIDGDDAGLG